VIYKKEQELQRVFAEKQIFIFFETLTQNPHKIHTFLS